MTFNKLSFKKSGRNIHRFLIKESYRIFRDRGYKVSIEYNVLGNKTADVYAERDKEKLIIECLVKPTLHRIKEKIENYKGYKMVVVYPESFVPTFPIEDFVEEVIKVKVPLNILFQSSPNVIEVENKTRDEFNKDKLQLGNQINDDGFIKLLIKCWRGQKHIKEVASNDKQNKDAMEKVRQEDVS